MPEQGISGSHEHTERLKGKRVSEKRKLWTGLAAPGEAMPLAFAISVCAGAALYLLLPFEPEFWVCALVAGMALFAMIARASGWASKPLRIGLVITIGVCIGFLAGKLRAYNVEAPTISQATGPVMLEGWVTGVEGGQNGARLRIKPHAIGGLSTDKLPALVRVTHRLDLNVAPGRFVRCWSVLRPPPGPALPGDYDFRRQAWFQQLGAVGYVQGRCRGGTLGKPPGLTQALRLNISAHRRRLAEHVNAVSGVKANGFAAALISGDRSFMPPEDQESLRAAGLAHLLAVSGLHLGIVGGLVYFIFRNGLALIQPISLRIPVQKPAALAALLAVALYLVISGASVSTQRAFIMSAVFFGAMLIDRPALSLRSFSVAMIAVVLISPESVFAPGFQMSFAATGVLIAIYEAWSRRRSGGLGGFGQRFSFGAKSLVVTSIAASIATAPFALFHFERLAPLGLLANLVAMPVVSLVTVPAAGLSMLLAVVGMEEIGLRLFGWSLELVMDIARWAEDAGTAYRYPLKTMPAGALLLLTSALILLVALRRWARLVGVGLASICGGVVWALQPVPDVYWSPSGEVYANLEGGRYTVIDFADGDALGPLRFRAAGSGQACIARTCNYALNSGTRLRLLQDAPQGEDCRQPGAQIIMSMAAPPSAGRSRICPSTIYWTDVLQNGGLAASSESSGVVTRYAKKCSARPWRQC